LASELFTSQLLSRAGILRMVILPVLECWNVRSWSPSLLLLLLLLLSLSLSLTLTDAVGT